jgi:hypothetical protein
MNTTTALALTILLSISLDVARAQDHDSFSPAEKMLLKTLLEDTVSNTVAYLSRGYVFNMPDESQRNLILVKSGKKNRFMRIGSQHLYDIDTSGNNPKLKRIDSAVHAGHNFRCMGFLRKDTVFQHGGYGFWKTNDFFTFFDERTNEWAFYPAANTFPNELSYHYYDRKQDAFYAIGSHYSDEHVYNSAHTIDTVYRFDFSERKWSSLGKLQPENRMLLQWIWIQGVVDPTLHSSFGLIEFSGRYPGLIDLAQNRIYKSKENFFDKYRDFSDEFSRPGNAYKQIMHLNDTAHFFLGTGSRCKVWKIRMTREDFETDKWTYIYSPKDAENDEESSIGTFGAASLILFISAIGSLLLLKAKRRRLHEIKNEASRAEPPAVGMTSESQQAGQDDEGFSDNRGDIRPPLERFMAALTTGESELVRKLLTISMQGGKMDISSVNKLLGVGKKDESVQKTRRSMAISNINNTFSLTMKSQGKLIRRERDPEDKRSNLYYISEEYYPMLSGQMEM